MIERVEVLAAWLIRVWAWWMGPWLPDMDLFDD